MKFKNLRYEILQTQSDFIFVLRADPKAVGDPEQRVLNVCIKWPSLPDHRKAPDQHYRKNY